MNIELISFQTLLCCLAFFFAGIVDSITGGGGLITIPAMLAVGIPVRFITGTNQCSAWIGSGVAAFKYMRSGNIHLKSALITLPFAVIGSYLGARLNLIVPVRYLKVFMLITVPVIAVFLVVFFAFMASFLSWCYIYDAHYLQILCQPAQYAILHNK